MGEAFSCNCQAAVEAALDTMVASLFLGGDSSRIVALTHEAQRALHLYGRYDVSTFALSGIDIALSYLAGKRAGRSVGELSGGVKSPRIDGYPRSS